jgi:hypothetical protein
MVSTSFRFKGVPFGLDMLLMGLGVIGLEYLKNCGV